MDVSLDVGVVYLLGGVKMRRGDMLLSYGRG